MRCTKSNIACRRTRMQKNDVAGQRKRFVDFMERSVRYNQHVPTL